MDIDWTDLVHRFNEQTLRKEEWTHEAHLVTGLWHLLEYKKIERAMCYLRPRIIIRNHRVGVPNTDSRGYHETITVFWLRRLQIFIQERQSRDFNELVGTLLNEADFFLKDYILRFYCKDILMSPRARGMYIPCNMES